MVRNTNKTKLYPSNMTAEEGKPIAPLMMFGLEPLRRPQKIKLREVINDWFQELS